MLNPQKLQEGLVPSRSSLFLLKWDRETAFQRGCPANGTLKLLEEAKRQILIEAPSVHRSVVFGWELEVYCIKIRTLLANHR